LGGNTIFIRRCLLESVRGWDPESLTEDCDLGARLSILSARVAVVTLPQLATREEVPPSVGSLFRQRTRWDQGFLQVLRKGDWRHLPLRSERFLAAYTLAMPFLQALMALSFPAAVVAFLLLKVPTLLALLTFVPGVITLVTLVVESTGLWEFCRIYGLPCTWRDHARLILGTIPYQALLASAALWAIVREIRKDRGWAKTPHRGLLPGGPGQSGRLAVASGPIFPGGAMRGSWRLEAAALGPARLRMPFGAALPASQIGVVVDVPRRTEKGETIAPPARQWWKPLAPPSYATRIAGRTRGWVRAHGRSIAVVASLLTIVGVVHAWGLSRSPGYGDDEGTYAAQAWAVLNLHRLSSYTYWYDHPPMGWLLLAAWALLTRAFSRYGDAVVAGREAVLVCQLASCGLLYVLARRLSFRRGWAAATVAVFAFSPLGLYVHRMAFLDNIATPFVIGSFVLALSPHRRLVAHAGAGACFAAAVLVKETSLLLLPALALQLWQATDARTWRFSLALSGAVFLGVTGLYPLYAALKGELLPGPGHVSLLGSMAWQLFERASSGTILSPSSGARSLVSWWLSLDPWLPVTALALAPAAMLVRRLRPAAVAVLVPVAVLLRPGYLPAMQVIAILPFAALLVAGIPDSLWSHVAGYASDHRGGHAPATGVVPRLARWLSVAASSFVLVLVVVGSIAVVGTRWAQRDAALLSANQTGSYDEAKAWIVMHVPKDATMLVDSVFWLNLVEKGFHPVSVVWFYKLDLDPGVAKRFSAGWRDFDYVVASPVVRDVTHSMPSLVQVDKALENSTIVAAFGSGSDRIEIRKVETHTPGRLG
jgi:hypothetical protein